MKIINENGVKTLFIDEELCKEYKACKEGILFLKRKYPEGLTARSVIKKENRMPNFFIHWAAINLPLTDDDVRGYFELMNIKNSFGVEDSMGVINSLKVISSREVKDSMKIINSQYVIQSQDIISSTDIENSSQVESSTGVYDSRHITKSINIKNSETIIKGKDIEDSSFLYDCNNIINGHYLYNSEKCKRVLFAKNLKGCSNKLFCHSIENNDDYMMFNKKVSSRIFQDLYEEVLRFLISHAKEDENSISTNEFFNIIKSIDNGELFLAITPILSNPDFVSELEDILFNFDKKIFYEILNM